MNKRLINKRMLMISFLPALGLVLTYLLNFMASVVWSVVAFFTGVYMYSKCSSMNHLKFVLGILSISLAVAMPWLIGKS